MSRAAATCGWQPKIRGVVARQALLAGEGAGAGPGMRVGLVVGLDRKSTEPLKGAIDIGLVTALAADGVPKHVGDFQSP